MVYISNCKTEVVLAERLNGALHNFRWFSTQIYQVNFNHNKNWSFELNGSLFKIRLVPTLFSFLTERQLSYFLPGASGAGSSCGGPGEGTRVITWHVNQLCMDTIRIHQIPVSTKQTGEVAIRVQLRVWSTYLVMAPRFLETPNWFSSDSPWVTCCQDTRGRRRRHDNNFDHAGHECGMKLIFLNWSQCLRCSGPCWEFIRPLLVRSRTDSGDRCGTSSLWFISSPLWWIMWKLSALWHLDSRHSCLME